MAIVFLILRYIALLVFIILIAGLFASQSWGLHQWWFTESGGSWIDLGDLAGFMLNYILLVPLTLILLGEKRKYWLVALFLAPIFLFELGSDFRFVMMDISLLAIGFAIGLLIRYIATQTLGKMPKLEQYKKYF